MKRSKHWLNKIAAFFIITFWAGSLGAAPTAAFAESCECFCGDQDLGAFSAGAYGSANECAKVCSDASVTYVGCYTDEAMYPENNNLCWTSDECTKYPVEIGLETYSGEWGKQNVYCAKKSVTGDAMGYCYGPLIPVVLNVPILGVTQIGSIGAYVNIVYKYAIPAAAMFAALMFTIAGFQYMTAGGDKSAVAKAKGRMVNTVIGIILLMSVYTIAYLIDPRLTRFNELRPPLVKKAILIDEATTCEALFAYGFCIDGNCPSGDGFVQGECAEKGTITGDDEVVYGVVNPPKVGDECMYSRCDDAGTVCIVKGDNSGGACVSCNDVSDLNEETGLDPSESVCSAIQTKLQKNEKNKNHVYACYFDSDLSAFSEGDGIGSDECVQFYTSGKEYVDCIALQDTATREEDGCSVYDQLNADSYGVSWSGNLAEATGFGSADSIEDFKTAFGDLCERDVCSLADSGTVSQGRCNFVDSNTLQDILDAVIGATFLTVFDEYACVGSETLTPQDSESADDTDMHSPTTF